MGFGGILKTLGKLGAVGAAPFTGGGSLAALPAIDAIGGVLGGGAGASKEARINDALLQANMNNANNRSAIDAGTFNMNAPGARVSQAARGDLLSTMKDAAPTGDPRIDRFGGGGLRPSAFGASTRQAGSELQKQALLKLMSGGDQITPIVSKIPDAGFMEQLGGGLGVAGGLAGALQEAGRMAQVKRWPIDDVPQAAAGNPWAKVQF